MKPSIIPSVERMDNLNVFGATMQRLPIVILAVITLLGSSLTAYAQHNRAPGRPHGGKSSAKLDADLLSAAGFGDYATVVKLVGLGANVNARDDQGRTPITEAAFWDNDAKTIEFLVHHGANVNEHGDMGDTPLMKASVRGSLPNVKALLALGASPTAHGEYGGTALYDAAMFSRDINVITVLLAHGAKIDAADEDGDVALSAALHSENPQAARTLIEAGANVTLANHEGIPVWMQLRRRIDLLPLLLKHGASINDRTRKGLTCLHLAAMTDGRSEIDALIAVGADVNATGPHGETAFSLASTRDDINRDDVVNTLIAAGEKDAHVIAKKPDVLVDPSSDEAAIAKVIIEARVGPHGALLFVRDTMKGKDTSRWIDELFFRFRRRQSSPPPTIVAMHHDLSESQVLPDYGVHDGYSCVRAADINDLLKEGRDWNKVHSKYPGAFGTVTLSNPSISADRQHATVLLEFECGGLCGGMELWTVDKTSGVWVVGNHKELAQF